MDIVFVVDDTAFFIKEGKKKGEILESHGDLINTRTCTNKSLRHSTRGQKAVDLAQLLTSHMPMGSPVSLSSSMTCRL